MSTIATVKLAARTFFSAEALIAFRRVRLDSAGDIVYADAREADLGTTENGCADNEYVSVRLRQHEGTNVMIASGAISVGDRVYGADDGKVTASMGGHCCGIALTSATADGDQIEVLRFAQRPIHKVLTAAGTAITNTTTETSLGFTETIKANELQVGDVIEIDLMGIATSTNSTDTLKWKLYLNAQAIADTGALDVANNDIISIKARITIRTIGASGTMVAELYTFVGTAGTAAVKPQLLGSTAIDTTVDQVIDAKATWSVASASNSCRLDSGCYRMAA